MSHITDEAGEPALKVNIVRLINLLETHESKSNDDGYSRSQGSNQ